MTQLIIDNHKNNSAVSGKHAEIINTAKTLSLNYMDPTMGMGVAHPMGLQ
jgi:hypothetical protein